jgi:hypothetical protein
MTNKVRMERLEKPFISLLLEESIGYRKWLLECSNNSQSK